MLWPRMLDPAPGWQKASTEIRENQNIPTPAPRLMDNARGREEGAAELPIFLCSKRCLFVFLSVQSSSLFCGGRAGGLELFK